jgi:hypothetical protein
VLKPEDYFEDLDVDKRNNIKMNLKEIKWEGVDWINPAQDTDKGRRLCFFINLLKPSGNFTYHQV